MSDNQEDKDDKNTLLALGGMLAFVPAMFVACAAHEYITNIMRNNEMDLRKKIEDSTSPFGIFGPDQTSHHPKPNNTWLQREYKRYQNRQNGAEIS